LLFPPAPSCQEPPTPSIILNLDASQDKWQGSIISVVFKGIKTIETITEAQAANADFSSRKRDELLFPAPPSCPKPPTFPIILHLDAIKDKWQG
jgi:hypothetical protein